MSKIQKFDLLLNFQIAVAFFVSVFISQSLGLINPITAGVVTLLSIQTTKKQTILIAIKRLFGFIITIFLSVFIFYIFGFSLFNFGIFVLVFAIISSALKISIGLAPNVVMASHIFLENKIEISFLKNEIYIFLIGLLIAILVNLIIPYFKNRDRIDRVKLDNHIKNMLVYLSNLLNENYLIEDTQNDRELYFLYINGEISKIKKYIEKYEKDLIRNIENDLFGNNFYDLEYLELRQRQFSILTKIYEQSKKIDSSYLQTQKISNFIEEIHDNYDEENTAIELIEKANNLLIFFKRGDLPRTRIEFENRAILFIILEDLITFLREKYKFSK